MGVIKVSSFLRAGSEFLDLMESLLSKSSLRSYFAELLSSFIFVFAGVGSTMSSESEATSAEAHLLTVAVAHAFAMSAAVFMSEHISGGHVNPAVSVGLVVGGQVSILTALCYVVAQLLGSSLACALLMLVSAGQAIPVGRLAPRIPLSGGVVMEGITTFAIVCTVSAARDPRNGSQGITGPMAIGFIQGANIIVTSPFTGGYMNPARSFGPAVVSGDFRNHWVYWIGPFLGGGLAGFIYRSFLVQATGNQRTNANVAV
ncbi:hypothetical protein CDL15_Pgr019318 [Punica granatum]|uniref:Aquaporin TIP2-1-like n=1 Tax=Punica granatum TaxID=22663 RepID=A0A218X5D9_PUNGR|nr:hypothetical protein CDL15_Pgr019318 [Punica granatum]PKI79517.1 hypothetical protein CRG98_000086 [Punica granatum]